MIIHNIPLNYDIFYFDRFKVNLLFRVQSFYKEYRQRVTHLIHQKGGIGCLRIGLLTRKYDECVCNAEFYNKPLFDAIQISIIYFGGNVTQ